MTLAQAKEQLALAGSSQDAHLTRLIAAARTWAETRTKRAIIRQRWRVTLDDFPPGAQELRLPKGLCLSVVSVAYRDTSGAWITLSGPSASPVGTGYEEDLDGHTAGILRPVFEDEWPDTASVNGAVRIEAWFGYGTAADDVPGDLRQAILYRLADLYDNRSETDGKWAGVADVMLTPYALLEPTA